MTDDLDSILDAALSEYSNSEPRPGLEHRVLRSIRTIPPARRSWWWAGWVLAAVALALIVLRSDRARVKQVPQSSHATASSAQQPQPTPSWGALSVPEGAGASHHRVRSELPRLETFPEPEPLTAEERELLRFVQSQPQQVREALAQSAEIEELTIEPLKIEELP
jgi:hypothetical protein